jgi:hypothetical protein
LSGSEYNESVFLNCPFDSQYRPFFEALVFSVHDCGFVARCALEIDDASQVRIEKITTIISQCGLGVHDISRTEADAASALPRFNMPLELGLYLGAKRYGGPRQKQKLCLILDRERYRYQQFCSDIAGQDIQSHGGSPHQVVRTVRNWLRNASRDSRVIIPSGSRMVARYEHFQAELPLLCNQLRLDRDDLIFNDLTMLVAEWLKGNRW